MAKRRKRRTNRKPKYGFLPDFNRKSYLRKLKAKKLWKKGLPILATIAFLFFLVGIFGFIGALAFFSKDLPSPYKLTEREIAQSTKIYDRGGTLLYEVYGDINRTLVSLSDIPDYLKNATLAVEDANFYEHEGFDLKGFLRSVYLNLTREGTWGGSTITQQLVKNTLLSPERTFTRKIKELVLAVQIERRYSKDEILQMYFNEVPYGGQAWGIEAASQMYFGKHVSDLTVAESALLAGLPQSPTQYSPFGVYPENAKKRQEYVLHLMVKNGFLTKDQLEAAKAEELHFIPQGQGIKAPHFVMYVKDILEKRYGSKLVEQGGLKVTTTLDYGLQVIGEEEVKYQIDRLAAKGANAKNAALVSIDPRTGEILAMVGSVNYFDKDNDGNVNVTLSDRQPGSSIKPIMYVTAFMKGYTASTFLSDIKTTWPSVTGKDYTPEESDGKYWGPMLLREALGNSRNVPAVKMLEMVGVKAMLDTAHRMGITTLNEPERYGLSLTLGGGEVKLLDLTSAFGVFANSGVRQDPVAILKVEDSKGKVLEEYKKGSGKRVLEEKYAYLISNILSDNIARSRLFGTGSLLQIRDWKVAVKTGTTNDNRDAWTIGYVPNLVTGVWAGNNNNDPMRGIQGSTGATPVWHYFMERALDGKERGEFVKPEKDFVTVEVCSLSGKLPTDDCPDKKSEIFIKGTEPQEKDNFYQRLLICTETGKLASDLDKELDLAEEKFFKTLIEINLRWQPYTDEWMKNAEGYEKPPSETCSSYHAEANHPLVKIKTPKEGEEVGFEFEVEAEVFSPFSIAEVEFFLDETPVKSLTSVPYKTTFSLSKDEAGEHTVLVKGYDAKANVGTASITVVVNEESLDQKEEGEVEGSQAVEEENDFSFSMKAPHDKEQIFLPYILKAQTESKELIKKVEFYVAKKGFANLEEEAFLVGESLKGGITGVFSYYWNPQEEFKGNYLIWAKAIKNDEKEVESEKVEVVIR